MFERDGWSRQNPRVVYHPYRGYEKSKDPRYIVQWDLQWKIIESGQPEANVDLRAEMAAAIARATAEGRQAESDASFGFVFIRRNGERRLMALTPGDSHDTRPQSFSPFNRL